MSGIGKDSDYWGGEFRRDIDHFLRNNGIPRDHPIQRGAHAAEHTFRGIVSAFQGNFGRAGEEFRRAGSNFGDVSNYAD
jgi:hypothetical protein